jgi:hypothetical protein
LKKYNFTSKKQLPVLAVVVSKPRAMSCEFKSSQSSSLVAQSSIEKKNFKRKKILPVSAMAVCRPRATSCELTCSQSSSLVAQSSVETKKINMENTTAGKGSGCEQAQGHEL